MTEPVDLQRVTSSRSRLMLRSSQSAQPNDAGSVLGSVQQDGPDAGQVDTGVAINNHPSKSFPSAEGSVQGHKIHPHGGEGRQLVDITEIPYGYGHGYYEERPRSRGSGLFKGAAVVALCVVVGLSSAYIALSVSTNQAVKKTLHMNTLTRDSDGDGLSDELELRLNMDPFSRDTNGDGKNDGAELALILETQTMMMAKETKAPKPKATPPPKATKAPKASEGPLPAAMMMAKESKAPKATKAPKASGGPLPAAMMMAKESKAPGSKAPKTSAVPKTSKVPASKTPKTSAVPKTSKAPLPAPLASSLSMQTVTMVASEEVPVANTTDAAAIDTEV